MTRPSPSGPAAPTFSVITVCFNAIAELPRTVASLNEQQWPGREWVLVDGASSDGTQAWVQACSERPSTYISEHDRGIYDAMNKGVAMARCEYVHFLNAGDRLHDPGVLGHVASLFAADAELDLVFGNVVVLKPECEILRRNHYINRWTLPLEDLCHQAVFARRSLFKRFGGFELRWTTSADYDWLLRVFYGGAKVGYTDRRVVYYQAGGAHAKDPEALAAERRSIRLQYSPAWRLACGRFASRVVHRASRSLRGGLWFGESVNRG